MAAVEVSVLADPDPGARDRAATLKPGAMTVADWREAIAADVDAVVVALPTALHAETAVAAIEAGKHAYLEKPVAATVDEGRRVIGVARLRPDPVVCLGFNYRFNPLVVELRTLVQAGEIGALRAIRSTFSTRAIPGGWRHPDARGGGVLLDLGSHHIDLLRYITEDEVTSVKAERAVSSDGAERVALEAQLSQGAVVASTFATGANDVDRIEVEGARGVLALDRYRSWVVQRDVERPSTLSRGLRDLGGWRYALEKRRSPWHEPSFAHALQAFVAAARGADQQGASLEDGLRSLLVIDAADCSCREGSCVEMLNPDTCRAE
jgi:predicted dehydrogenase